MTLSGTLRSLAQTAALLRPAAPQSLIGTWEPEVDAHRHDGQRVNLGGVPVQLLGFDKAVQAIIDRATRSGPLPLAVASANLDHVKHFGQGARWADVLERPGTVEWLTLLDGAPLVAQAGRVTRRRWPRLAGSDLIGPILESAEAAGLRVGFLGGTSETHRLVRNRLKTEHPNLLVSGWWSPQRSLLADPQDSQDLAAEISESGTDVLVLCLGKPRQELWISEYGNLTGAKVLLAFGAVVDFLAGRVQRAPAPLRHIGLEWAWRLALEPRRLANRYLLDGPEAYFRLRRCSSSLTVDDTLQFTPEWAGPQHALATTGLQGFCAINEPADIAVLIVSYNSEADVAVLLESLRSETAEQSIKVVVADNSPSPSTLQALNKRTDVFAFATGGNLGYAAAINAAMAMAGTVDAYLVLNPDMRVMPGSIRSLRNRIANCGAGVAVPLLLDDDGRVYPSIRREPSIFRAIGDALAGRRLPTRPGWLSEIDYDAESYMHAHKVDWATGAALLIRADIALEVGEWDEKYFLYSEETDFMHRVRAAGAEVWFDPAARMMHKGGGSGTSKALIALMATNRIRYVRKFHPGAYARAFRAAVVFSALLRLQRPYGVDIFRAVSRERRWDELPCAVRYPTDYEDRSDFPSGTVIIPAHNEAAVIGRTLTALAEPLASGAVEVIVACNGCDDGTEQVAKSFPGVHVLEVTQASKIGALNAADRVATRWPRVYLDADIELPADALRATLERLTGEESPLCARPLFRYDTEGASWSVRAYYRARNRLPQASSSIWGAGIYGLSQQGHDRLGVFPAVTADDYYVNHLFDAAEKVILECSAVTVRTPRSAGSLMATLKRVYRGNSELDSTIGPRAKRVFGELVQSMHGPGSAFDAAVYAFFAVAARLACRRGGVRWERDNSSRA